MDFRRIYDESINTMFFFFLFDFVFYYLISFFLCVIFVGFCFLLRVCLFWYRNLPPEQQRVELFGLLFFSGVLVCACVGVTFPLYTTVGDAKPFKLEKKRKKEKQLGRKRGEQDETRRGASRFVLIFFDS